MKKDETRKLYAAYGSNMNMAQMAMRCPKARLVGVGFVDGYKLNFRGWPGRGVATIEPTSEDGARVPVVVWSLTKSDEAALDRYEGWPRLYRKELVSVQMEPDGREIEAMAYVMSEGRPEARPSRLYFHCIWDAYNDFCLDDTDLIAAAIKKF